MTSAGKKRLKIDTYGDREKYYKNGTNKLNNRGKKLQKFVREQAGKNIDVLSEYEEERNLLQSTRTNPRAKKLVDDYKKKFEDYRSAKDKFEKTGSEKDRKKMDSSLEDLTDSHLLINARSKHDNDELYYKYVSKLAEKTVGQISEAQTIQARLFVQDLIGDYYKHDLD